MNNHRLTAEDANRAMVVAGRCGKCLLPTLSFLNLVRDDVMLNAVNDLHRENETRAKVIETRAAFWLLGSGWVEPINTPDDLMAVDLNKYV